MYGNSAGIASMLKKRNLSLCLSAKEKQLPQSEFRLPGAPILSRGIYDRTIILPPGIRNEGNICYAISVVQCLFNHSTFRDSLAEVCAFHEGDGQCEMCLQKGMVLSGKNEVINT